MNPDESGENGDDTESPALCESADALYQKLFYKHTSICADDILMEIDSSLVGIVIGKSGKTINRLKADSGAIISIIDCDFDRLSRVRISGSKAAKNIAMQLISNLIEETNQNRMIHKAKLNNTSTNSEFVQSISNFNWDELMKEHAEKLQDKLATLPIIIKNFYEEHPEVSKMTDQEVEKIKLSMNNIMVKYIDVNNTKPIPKPVLSFSHAFKNYPEILREIKKQKFKTPSPVQCQAWPIIMSGYDLIAIAQTGTGKTLAALLPAFIHLELQPTPRSERKGPSILVIAPTRELVLQIETEVNKYSYKGIKTVSIYGGASSSKQKEYLQRGAEIVIATPGRLNDFVRCGAIHLMDVTFLILDEADRMMDLGFEPQICSLLLKMRPDRQTIMMSATWPPTVENLASRYTTNPIQIVVGSTDLTTVNTVQQEILIMDENAKQYWLYDFLKTISTDDKVIIFMNQKSSVDIMAENLLMLGYNIEHIHGDRDQRVRQQAMNSLRNGDVSILIATNIASRGINIDGITIVINYDFAKDIEEYVHRVGRTGRAGKTGLAISLFTRRDWRKAKDLVEVLENSGQVVPKGLKDMAYRHDNYQKKQKEELDGSILFSSDGDQGSGFSSGKSENK